MGHFGDKVDQEKLPWFGWSPGLSENEDMTLGEILDTLPASPPGDVPAVIRKYENPFLDDGVTPNPDALPGAIELRRHDCIHIIVGRGLFVQDEAFVIGFTMGAASEITEEHLATFRRVCVEEYPNHWRFSEADLHAFNLGVGAAMTLCPKADLHLYPFEAPENLIRSVREIRRQFGLKPSRLRAYFIKERVLLPDTKASSRLDVTAADDMRIVMPVGECAGLWENEV